MSAFPCFGSSLTTVYRSARVPAYPPLSMQIQSSRRGTLLPVLCAQHVVMNSFSQKVPASFRRAKGECQTSQSCVFAAYAFSDMPTSTTLLFEVPNTISSQRRSHHMILCANGPQTSASGCKTSPLTMPRVWTTVLLLGWFRNFISPHIAKSVEPTSRSTMSLGRGGETWKVRKERGLDYRVAEAPRIKAPDTGATRWTTNLGIGTGLNLYALVCNPTCISRGEC